MGLQGTAHIGITVTDLSRSKEELFAPPDESA